MYGPVVLDLYEQAKTYEKNLIPLDVFLQDLPKLEKEEKKTFWKKFFRCMDNFPHGN